MYGFCNNVLFKATPLYAASYTGSTDFVLLTVRYTNNSQGDQTGVPRHYVCGGPDSLTPQLRKSEIFVESFVCGAKQS